jgi:dTDP-4-amino-4,6-dideoxygalactose transaminase/lipopolysaccharide/colanic/teichoic acid biosynthesis glycosyltransferase
MFTTIQSIIKRAIDLTLSVIAFITFLPVFMIVGLAVYCTSGSPILFKQVRVGRKFETFKLIKFRTMVTDCVDSGAKITSHNDSRITRIGHILRNTKIDELPQLWNIIVGDMSIVGPRPEVPEYVNRFRNDFSEILMIRPGLTDFASIKYRNESQLLAESKDSENVYLNEILPDKIRLAKKYLLEKSLITDLKIIIKTAISILKAESQVVPNESDTATKIIQMNVPFFRPKLTEAEIIEVSETLRSGWITTGPKVRRFENDFASAVRADHALALSSCTAALHLAVESLGLKRGQAVLVPTLTFAATAEIVRYCEAIPLLVDCDEKTFNIALDSAEGIIQKIRSGSTVHPSNLEIVGIIPVHVGGYMCDMADVNKFASKHKLWVVEDAAHAFPAAYRDAQDSPWKYAGNGTADVTCFSFYANKTITTGEGGMAVTNRPDIDSRMRQMALHGLSHDAWERYSGGQWDYKIVEPGYKYNLTDIAASLGIHQLKKAENFRLQREEIANRYLQKIDKNPYLQLPIGKDINRVHSWHLFPIRLKVASEMRNEFITLLKSRGIATSVHWRPLHLHPYYSNNETYAVDSLPNASQIWEQLISLPIFPGMTEMELDYVIYHVNQLTSDLFKEAPECITTRCA